MPKEVKFAHIRRKDGGVNTFAFTTVTRSDGVIEVDWNVAKCCPKDQFIKAVGRARSQGRLLGQGPTGGFIVKDYKAIVPTFNDLSNPVANCE